MYFNFRAGGGRVKRAFIALASPGLVPVDELVRGNRWAPGSARFVDGVLIRDECAAAATRMSNPSGRPERDRYYLPRADPAAMLVRYP